MANPFSDAAAVAAGRAAEAARRDAFDRKLKQLQSSSGLPCDQRMQIRDQTLTEITSRVMAEHDILPVRALREELHAIERAAAEGRVPDVEHLTFFRELSSVTAPLSFDAFWYLPADARFRLPNTGAALQAAIRVCQDLLYAIEDDNPALAHNAIERLFMFCDVEEPLREAAHDVDRRIQDTRLFAAQFTI